MARKGEYFNDALPDDSTGTDFLYRRASHMFRFHPMLGSNRIL